MNSKIESLNGSLDQQLSQFLNAMSMTDADRNKKLQTIRDLTSLLKKTYPNCILYICGSFVTGLGDPNSDIDLFLDASGVTKNSNAIQTLGNNVEVLCAVQQILKRDYSGIEAVLAARIPIIRAVHNRSRVRIDMSFDNLLGIRKSELINVYVKWSPVVRPLILLLRFWANSHGLLGSKMIKNYTLTLLVLVFLMRKRIVPTIYWLQNQSSSKLVDGIWNAGFSDNVDQLKRLVGAPSGSHSSDALSILKLAEEFFRFFATFNYSGLVVCTLIGDFVEKSKFEPWGVVPTELSAYKTWISLKNGNICKKYRLYVQRPFCVQDPIELNHNVADVVDSIVLHKFKDLCSKTASSIANICSNAGRGGNPMLKDMFKQ